MCRHKLVAEQIWVLMQARSHLLAETLHRKMIWVRNSLHCLTTVQPTFCLVVPLQNFIFMTVTNFGPLTCSIITTTRKFFTILMSVLIFQNPMSGRQWLGTVFVFIGLGLDSVYGKEKKKEKKESSHWPLHYLMLWLQLFSLPVLWMCVHLLHVKPCLQIWAMFPRWMNGLLHPDLNFQH